MWRIHVAMDVTFIYIYDALFYIHNGIGFLMLTIVKVECVMNELELRGEWSSRMKMFANDQC